MDRLTRNEAMPGALRRQQRDRRLNGAPATYGFAEHEWNPNPPKLNHLARRLSSRFGIVLTRDLYNALCAAIRSGEAIHVPDRAKGSSRSAWDVMIGETKVRLIYRARSGSGSPGYIITAMPPDGLYIAEPNCLQR